MRTYKQYRKLLERLEAHHRRTYIAPRPFHLDAYLDEQVFRFNERTDGS
jgi:hypothetical protein